MTTKVKYHINPETGRPGECTATVRGCAYSVNGMLPQHYDTLYEALDAYEEENADNTLASVKKPKSKSSRTRKTAAVAVAEDNEVVIGEIDEGDEQAQRVVELVGSDKAYAMSRKDVESTNAFVNKLAEMNPNSHEFNEMVNSIHNIGHETFNRSADQSREYLSTDRRNKQETKDVVAKDLTDLRNKIIDLSPQDKTFKGKVLGIIPFGNTAEKYFARFESDAKQLDVIVGSLENGKALLDNDNIKIAKKAEGIRNDIANLSNDNARLKLMQDSIQAKIDEAKSNGELTIAKALESDVLGEVLQRRNDVTAQTAVSLQAFMSLAIVRKNNETLSKNVERAKTITVTALATTLQVRSSVLEQKKVADAVDNVKDTTERMILENSRMLRDNSAKIQKQALSSAVSPEVIRESFNNVAAALDEMEKTRLIANETFDKSIKEFEGVVAHAQEIANRNNNRLLESNREKSNPFILER